MEKWRIIFYDTPAGNYPVKDFIRGLSAEKKAATIDAIDLLEEFGINLGMPHARPLSDGIWELRARASDGLTRVLYFSHPAKNAARLCCSTEWRRINANSATLKEKLP